MVVYLVWELVLDIPPHLSEQCRLVCYIFISLYLLSRPDNWNHVKQYFKNNHEYTLRLLDAIRLESSPQST